MPVKFRTVAFATKVFGDAPQVPVTGPPTAVIFASVSENEALVNGPVVFGLVRVKVTVDVPPAMIEVGENSLPIVGGATTVRFAVAAVPGLLFAVVTVLVRLVFSPTVVPVTITLKTQFVVPAKDGLLNEMTFAVIEYDPSPQTVVAAVFGAVTPPGNVSVKASVFNASDVFGLARVN